MVRFATLILLTTLFSSIDLLYSQELRTRLGDVYYDTNMYKSKYNAPDGSPYLNESFKPCQINNINGTQLVRFNAFEGNVEVKVSATEAVVLRETESYVITLMDGSGKIYETHNYIDIKGNLKHSFFELIHPEETYKLYLKEKIKFTKEVKAEGYKDAQPASFTKAKPSYFMTDLWNATPNLIKIPARQNAFLELFPEKARSLKKLIKEEKLKLSDPTDLIRIINEGLSQ